MFIIIYANADAEGARHSAVLVGTPNTWEEVESMIIDDWAGDPALINFPKEKTGDCVIVDNRVYGDKYDCYKVYHIDDIM